MRSVTCALVAFALALGCSSEGDSDDDAGGTPSSNDDFLGSCDTRGVSGPSLGQCRDWSGNANVDVSVSCSGLDGEFSASVRCPSDARVGTCTLEPVLGVSAVYSYYSSRYDAGDAEQHCAALDGAFQGA